MNPTSNTSTSGANDGIAVAPRPGELIAIVLAGASHVVLELAFSMTVAVVGTVVILTGFAIYVVRRGVRTPGLARAWGLRLDNLRTTAAPWLVFGAVGALVLTGFGVATGAAAPTRSFWLTLVLYPLWGTAQQFALQNLIARNLAGLLARPPAVAFVLIYRARPNLWAAGVVHGVLGSLAFHMVLKLDPTAAILRRVLGG